MATAPQTFLPPLSQISGPVAEWVESIKTLTRPRSVHWCEGSDAEYRSLIDQLAASGELQKLNPETFPNCYLARSNPSDVARVEHLTFVCTSNRDDAGPNNNWMAPAEAHAKMRSLFEGCMQDRTLYVIPYCMGPIDSPYSRCGVEITDSAYVAINMILMTRVGRAALERIHRDGDRFVKGLHSIGELDPNRRFIMHFPEELAIESFGSGYGGNALLGKKCHALRIASYQARTEGWLAEHMLIVGLQSPKGETHYVAAAFPSACGKTNLAMLIPPESMPGWKVFTVGDDIAWLHPGPDGRLYAINPEAGYFGVVPGTNPNTNRNAYDMIRRDTLFTNVALTASNDPWWEGLESGTPVIDWQGRPYDPKNGPAAHPNSRFTVSAKRNPGYSPEADSPRGVPISAIIFGGRRRGVAPLVYEARDWAHGVLMGASVASETTAAATGQAGVLRRDPMAMKPFCGYNFADYWNHWLETGKKLTHPPKIYHVNWFRRDAQNKFLWPGYGENLRVLAWILERCAGRGGMVETPIGQLPRPADLDLKGLDIAPAAIEELLSVDRKLWKEEASGIGRDFEVYGARIPAALKAELTKLEARLDA
ncbi:MAG: phosphoenolpyruvate carboxykinase (GTP) [Sinobacteraceae bacterium]|nr:phosphoenolpyruvate carboxykinase (GTP) [Nevskiaceae bacterium]MCP5467192.1 phosphoenolpyruvate carboxykinase (GTP) [Nevskiaceae bacterium]MCP5472985.1 phosphoenolpyruvate carboxykinase (GTP) [Nevskiaceae bacterium]